MKSRLDIRLMFRSDDVGEKELEALLDRQQEEKSPYESLLHTMCSANADSAARMLERLRSGAYDKALRLKGSATLTGDAEVQEYPWERVSRSSRSLNKEKNRFLLGTRSRHVLHEKSSMYVRRKSMAQRELHSSMVSWSLPVTATTQCLMSDLELFKIVRGKAP
jgi:hypothetical protein